MKYSITALVLTTAMAGTLAPAMNAATHKRASAPIVVTPAAIPDGSNMSRAPFPEQRQQNDVTPPNGMAFDQNLPPNTPSTTPDPVAPPPPAFAILQPRGEPGLTPTGRPTVAASSALAPAAMQPAIRNAAFESRDDLIDGLRTRVRQSDDTISQFRRTESEMSASGRTLFQSAADDVRAKQKALEHSLRAAGRASSANWDAARAQLASDYEAYTAAVSHLDTVVGVTPAQ